MKNKALIITIIAVVLIAFLCADAEAQCSMCRKVAADGSKNPSANISRNVNSAILYLMAVPYLALGFIFRKQLVGLYRSWRGQPKAEE
jgi:hypothetical protein